jgi:hypothetical protein
MDFTEITSFEAACAARGYDPATVLPDVSMFPVKHQAALTATAKTYIITEAINDGHEPDWNNSDEKKWYGWWDMEVDDNNPSGFRFYGAGYDYDGTLTYGGSRLSFRSKERLLHAAKYFLPLYRDMMVIPK